MTWTRLSAIRRWSALAVVLGVLVTGAGGLAYFARPPLVPAAAPPGARVAVVDLEAVLRAHPRWGEVEAINRRIAKLQGQFARLPAPPPPPRTDIQRALDEEAARMRAEFDKELDFLRQEGRRRLETFSALVREEHQAKFEATRKQLEVDGQAAIEAKRKELEAQLRAAEQEISNEYTYPLLNLRLRAEVAGLTSEQEGRAILREIQTLQEERETRLRAKGEEFDKLLREFQEAKTAEVNGQLEAAKTTLEQEGQERVVAKHQELEAEFKRSAEEREVQFRQRLLQRQKALVAAAEAQVRVQQRAYLNGLDARTRQLRAELAAVEDERARLEASMLAEVKVTVAAIAQAQKLDVVLTRYITNLSGENITAPVVQRLKR